MDRSEEKVDAMAGKVRDPRAGSSDDHLGENDAVYYRLRNKKGRQASHPFIILTRAGSLNHRRARGSI